MKSAIGIMGGTFNPFHNGHLQLALQAYRQFELSKVLVMPSGTPAHKSTKELIAASHRVNRCQQLGSIVASNSDCSITPLSNGIRSHCRLSLSGTVAFRS